MKLYDLTTLTIGVTAHGATQAALAQSLPGAGGRLLGCWTSDVGLLNRVMVLREFEGWESLQAARETLQASAEPLGCAALEALDVATYALFPFLPAVTPATHGRCYELRTYGLKHGRMPATIRAWQDAMPARGALSLLIGAFYALDGDLSRFLNIWAYPSADERARVRAEAVGQKVWPPVGGPTSLTHMTSTLAIPAAFSPLQ